MKTFMDLRKRRGRNILAFLLIMSFVFSAGHEVYAAQPQKNITKIAKNSQNSQKNGMNEKPRNKKSVQGWKIISNKLYYINKDGSYAVNKTIDKIRLTSKGYAKSDSISKLKIKTMKVAAKITKPSMSKKQKLRACWRYINTFRFKARSYPDKTKKNWKYQCALDMLNKKKGNCYGIANAFAALAKEVGYQPYVIEIPKVHCWVRINGKYWDNMGNRMGVSRPQRKYKKNQITKF